MIVAICQAEEFQATALAKSSAGTRLATNEAEAGEKKARATPNSASVAKIPAGPVRPRRLSASSDSAHSASSRLAIAMIRRRPKRSATTPVTSTSSKDGANWTIPTKPRSNGSPREIVDLPPHRNRDNLGGEGGEETGAPVTQEGAVTERGKALIGGLKIGGHATGGAGGQRGGTRLLPQRSPVGKRVSRRPRLCARFPSAALPVLLQPARAAPNRGRRG